MSERPPISPRSPRAALEPEQVPPPPKRSDRARNPLVVFGNAVITIVLILMIGAGGVYVYGKKMMESPAAGRGQDRQYSAALENPRNRRDVAARRCDRRQSVAVHGRGAGAEGQLRTQARRICVPEERQPARRHRHHRRRQGG